MLIRSSASRFNSASGMQVSSGAYRIHAQIPLVCCGLRPLLHFLVVLQILPCLCSAVILHAPSRVIRSGYLLPRVCCTFHRPVARIAVRIAVRLRHNIPITIVGNREFVYRRVMSYNERRTVVVVLAYPRRRWFGFAKESEIRSERRFRRRGRRPKALRPPRLPSMPRAPPVIDDGGNPHMGRSRHCGAFGARASIKKETPRHHCRARRCIIGVHPWAQSSILVRCVSYMCTVYLRQRSTCNYVYTCSERHPMQNSKQITKCMPAAQSCDARESNVTASNNISNAVPYFAPIVQRSRSLYPPYCGPNGYHQCKD